MEEPQCLHWRLNRKDEPAGTPFGHHFIFPLKLTVTEVLGFAYCRQCGELVATWPMKTDDTPNGSESDPAAPVVESLLAQCTTKREQE